VTWGWDYPVYVLRGWFSYACLDTLHTSLDGRVKDRPMKMVIVLTDSDLAERESATNVTAGYVVVPIESRAAFAQFIRDLPSDVDGAVFDPPTARGDWTVKTAKLRDELLTDLEMEI
jgi:hypothetical protein